MPVELSCIVNNSKDELKLRQVLRGMDLIGKILDAESAIHDKDNLAVSGNIKGVNYGNGFVDLSFLSEKPGSRLEKIRIGGRPDEDYQKGYAFRIKITY
ncbi:MAG: hypothetical protein V1839_01015 [archaeon]